jgi:acyl carrier protein
MVDVATDSYGIARDAVFHALEQIVYDGVTITEDKRLRDIGLDSLDSVELIMEIEDDLDIFIEDALVEYIETVGDFVKVTQKCYELKHS